VHAHRSAQNAVVLNMRACRIAVKFRTPEKETARSMAGQYVTNIVASELQEICASRPHENSRVANVNMQHGFHRPAIVGLEPLAPGALLTRVRRECLLSPSSHRCVP
jgi:hypothetical protein